MSNVVLSTEIETAITSAVAATEGAARKLQSSIDTLEAAKMRSTDFISPKTKDGGSTATPEQWEAIRAAVVAGFTKPVQQLLAKPTKSLSDVDKHAKRTWQQQIGARINDFKRGLEKREEKREGKSNDRAARQPKAAIDKLRAALETVEKIIQGQEAWDFDVTDFMDHIKAANKIAK